MSGKTILIRADAGFEMGTGHVMRCLALAQAWRENGGEAVFALAESTPSILARLSADGFEHVSIVADRGGEADANSTAELACQYEASWMVLDGYGFNSDYQEGARSRGTKILLIDDMGASERTCADIVLNANVNATGDLYTNRNGCKLLLGTQYLLLRREFVEWTGWRRMWPADVKRALVSIGGSDPTGFTGVLMSNKGLAALATTFLFGGSARDGGSLQGRANAELLKDEPDMPKLMSRSDITVLCAGGTLWESLFMGCATVSFSRNSTQDSVLQDLQSMGAARWMGRIESYDPARLSEVVEELALSESVRKRMYEAGKKIVDGGGAQRVVEILRNEL